METELGLGFLSPSVTRVLHSILPGAGMHRTNCTNACTHTHVGIQTCAFTHVCACAQTLISHTHTYTHTHTHMRTHTHTVGPDITIMVDLALKSKTYLSKKTMNDKAETSIVEENSGGTAATEMCVFFPP